MVTYSCMLSTFDNPFDPFEQFTSWLMFDKEKGYDSCERLARIAKITDEMSQKEINNEVERAIDRLIQLDFTNTFIKIKKETKSFTVEEAVEASE